MSDQIVAFGYCRVSTIEQAESGLSLDAQQEQIHAICRERGWQLERVFIEQESGAARDRPELASCMDFCAEHGERGVLVVTKLDRLGRSLIHTAEILQRSRDEGWLLMIADLGLDTSFISHRLVLGVLASVAEWERSRISERISEAMAQKRAQGWVGRPEIAEETKNLIMDLHEMGRSYDEIISVLEAEGHETARGGEWRRGTISRVVRRAKV